MVTAATSSKEISPSINNENNKSRVLTDDEQVEKIIKKYGTPIRLAQKILRMEKRNEEESKQFKAAHAQLEEKTLQAFNAYETRITELQRQLAEARSSLSAIYKST